MHVVQKDFGATKAIERFVALYEQEQGEPFGSPRLDCPEVVSLVDTECGIRESFQHITLIRLFLLSRYEGIKYLTNGLTPYAFTLGLHGQRRIANNKPMW